ncbi:tnp_zf-ribbon_2 domain-containing protein [Trichonephila clavipes]|nr:tnp_zf-ribbon_2 domain-containing protein [Trichonephila clavipes]
MTAKSSSSETTDIDEEKDVISVPGPFCIPKFASNTCSGPVKLKFRKHAVSEEDRLKNVGQIPTKHKSRRCVYCSTRAKPHRTRWMCPYWNVGLCMIAKKHRATPLRVKEDIKSVSSELGNGG